MKKSTVRNWFQNARSKARKAAEALANPHLQQEYQQGGDSGSEVGSNVGSTLSFADSSVLGSSQVSMNVGPSFVGQQMQQQQQQVYYSQNHVQQAAQPQPVEREARSVNVMSISALI
ncbi:hypothetical protein HDU79_010776 [Rhizoclosmatium sp. JEL0117]|nr:hypothetical protein HDU79_010776 [Rhizoclosmatium sp. JEL0117]